MWKYEYVTEVSGIDAESLWKARADVRNWSKWDSDIEWTRIEGEPVVGKEFLLKPKGGFTCKAIITESEMPFVFGDVTRLPGAKMKFVHFFSQKKNGTEIKVELSITGPLGFLWRKIIGEEQAKGMSEEIRTFSQLVKEEKK
ncbi:polyketide cyclase [Leptospira langatensis]|uniref:Polyketide cyclase n=1 Tax=Leptospira langatensis TaxID=2484983 RepID=A0A5F1ZVB2_9LEPT|nr:polyketide cyclase [Leptospira langatensis]TGK00178.1 polyketide cyclase [Leptospira langatensis]TGL41192.1 polyketide cyclase [Leptospira langatensis]